MTLFKQLALVISSITVLMLGSVMYINYASAKKDMIEHLYQTTVNNIATLTDQLSQASGEDALISSTIDVAFDSGYYKKIKFISSDQSFVYEQVDNEPPEGVPAWFMNFTNLHIQSVHSDVSSGWSSIGEVEVLGDTSVVYQALYEMLIKLLYLFVIFSIVSHIILSVLLHFVLKPLKDIQNQAEAIMNNKFVIQKKEPYTTEFKNVVKGMNSMVQKVEEIFNKANEAAQRNRELLYNDPVTKLYNRRYLMLKLPDLIKLENSLNGGTIIFLAFSSIEIINKLIGRQNAERLLQEFSRRLSKQTEQYENRLIARVNHTEFTLILCNCEAQEAESLARELNNNFYALLQKYEIDTHELSISMGLYRYRPNISIGDVLTRTDSALSKAKADEDQKIHIYEDKDKDTALGKEQWRAILEDATLNNHFTLKFWSMVDTERKKVHHKVMTFTIDGGEKKKYFYGDFIAPAINLGLVGKIYIVALKNLLTQEQSTLKESVCSVRLSNEFLKDKTALQALSSLLEEQMQSITFELFFEISDNFAFHNTQLVKTFVDIFNRYNIGFGLNAFTSDSDDFSYLKELNPAFIKADTSFLLDQSQESISALHVVTDALGIDIVASFVKTQEELQALRQMHIGKVQGPITDSLIESSSL